MNYPIVQCVIIRVQPVQTHFLNEPVNLSCWAVKLVQINLFGLVWLSRDTWMLHNILFCSLTFHHLIDNIFDVRSFRFFFPSSVIFPLFRNSMLSFMIDKIFPDFLFRLEENNANEFISIFFFRKISSIALYFKIYWIFK